MAYLLTFLEGILTFVSPCLLPMLPVYLSYIAGVGARADRAGSSERKQSTAAAAQSGTPAAHEETNRPAAWRAAARAGLFVLGFTVVFVALGAAAGTAGTVLRRYQTAFRFAGGALLVLFGLQIAGVTPAGLLGRTFRLPFRPGRGGFLSAPLLGVVFAVGWTPCVGVFLGSALMLAAAGHTALGGIGLLLLFSLGLGLPFVLTAVLMDSLGRALGFLRRHARAVGAGSGALLAVMGVLMMAGRLGT